MNEQPESRPRPNGFRYPPHRSHQGPGPPGGTHILCLLWGYRSSHVAGSLLGPPRRPHTVPVHLARRVLLGPCLVSWVHQVTHTAWAFSRTLVTRAPHTCSTAPLAPLSPQAAVINSVCLPVIDLWALQSSHWLAATTNHRALDERAVNSLGD